MGGFSGETDNRSVSTHWKEMKEQVAPQSNITLTGF